MTDRLAEIRARLDAAMSGPWWEMHYHGPWRVIVKSLERPDPQASHQIAAWSDERNADLIANAPADIAWLLERESQAMGALKMMSVMALHCCDAAIGRKSLDECLRDFGFTLDDVEARDA